MTDAEAGRVGFLRRIALHRPEMRAWALYDWANSAMYTVIVAAVFPVFFVKVVAAGLDADEARRAYGGATTIALAIAAVGGPLLGAVADVARLKKVLLGISVAIGSLSAAGLFFLGEGDVTLGLWMFGLCNLGAVGSVVFYDALLPHVAREDEIDQLSTSAFALGYLGGGLCLVLCTLMITLPGSFGLPSGEDLTASQASLPARLSFLIVGVWWAVFSIPVLTRVREPELAVEPDETAGRRPIRTAFQRLGETFAELRGYRQAFLMMIAFLIYNDGVTTIIRMAAVVGSERGIEANLMIVAIALVQFVGVPFTLLFGGLAGRIGPKRAILIGLGVYVGICVVAARMASPTEFLVLAVLVGMVQGGCQALSRSVFASLIPKHKSGEFFGLFSALEKFAGVLGPLVFTLSPSTEVGVYALIGFFLIGGLLFTRVDLAAGRKHARAIEASLRSPTNGAG